MPWFAFQCISRPLPTLEKVPVRIFCACVKERDDVVNYILGITDDSQAEAYVETTGGPCPLESEGEGTATPHTNRSVQLRDGSDSDTSSSPSVGSDVHTCTSVELIIVPECEYKIIRMSTECTLLLGPSVRLGHDFRSMIAEESGFMIDEIVGHWKDAVSMFGNTTWK